MGSFTIDRRNRPGVTGGGCSIYAHDHVPGRFLYLCAGRAFPAAFKPEEWRLVAHGAEPPEAGKPALKQSGFYIASEA